MCTGEEDTGRLPRHVPVRRRSIHVISDFVAVTDDNRKSSLAYTATDDKRKYVRKNYIITKEKQKTGSTYGRAVFFFFLPALMAD